MGSMPWGESSVYDCTRRGISEHSASVRVRYPKMAIINHIEAVGRRAQPEMEICPLISHFLVRALPTRPWRALNDPTQELPSICGLFQLVYSPICICPSMFRLTKRITT